ncbi:hypothetical protein [Cupriavidus sp. D384]|uniref:hypothetical protein n=1 Tax=Cupriavidus sp. D384 TaxID=1538095 RepID=UPI0012E85797|nr:hypothetical protein [Cupriavidus sp. D384]
MTTRKEEKARSRTCKREEYRALAYDELPALDREGAYILLANKLHVWSPTGATVGLVDGNHGTCVRFEYVNSYLGNKVGEWLDDAFRNVSRPCRLYSASDRTVNQGALVAWGAARGVPVTIAPACAWADAVSALVPSMVEVMNEAMMDATPDLRSQRLERWRIEYNSRLELPDFRA